MDKTEARAIIKCLQKKDMTHEETVALNCHSTLLFRQIQPRLTFICSLNSNNTSLVAGVETIRVVQEHLGDQDATLLHERIAVLDHRWTKSVDVNGGYIKNGDNLSRLCHPFLEPFE